MLTWVYGYREFKNHDAMIGITLHIILGEPRKMWVFPLNRYGDGIALSRREVPARLALSIAQATSWAHALNILESSGGG